MSEHVVSYYSVVHASDGPCSLRRSFPWDPISAMEFDERYCEGIARRLSQDTLFGGAV